MPKRTTHKERILNYFKTVGPITTWRAMKEFGNTRLAATVHSLKKDGHEIKSEMVRGKNRFGDDIRYSLYTLTKEAV